MIEKQRLEELIKQCATIYDVCWYNVYEEKLGSNHFIGIADDEISLMQRYNGYERELIDHAKNLFETKEEAEWFAEFGDVERIENLKLLPYEEICNGCDYDFVFSTPNHCRVTMFIGGNEIFIYKGISSCWSWELTKENYTLACRKAKELFLGENSDKENS